MKRKYDKKNNEKGAITLYVILACLFFVFILAGVYMSNLNKLQVQEKEVKQIQENYKRQIDRIEEIDQELSSEVDIKLSHEPKNDIWTKQVTLTGNAKIKTEESVITEYAFSKNEENKEDLEWKTVDSEKEISRIKENVTENGKYYFWIKDNMKRVYKSNEDEVTNIDNVAPIVGALIAKKDSAEGEEYTFDKNTDTDVYIEKQDGQDVLPGSGHKRTTMSILKNGLAVEEWTDIEGPVILRESGTYTIKLTTEDNVGNISTSKDYIVKIDKIVPKLSLKHNGVDGEVYESGTWTKDDLYGEITIDTDKAVEKYQYSYNNVVWEDITNEIINEKISFFDYAKVDNKVVFKLKQDMYKEIYIRAIYKEDNRASKSGDKTSIKIDKTAPVVENSTIEILSKVEANANIKVKEDGAGFKGYYIIEKVSDDMEILTPTENSEWIEMQNKEFSIENLNTNSTYYLWLIDNVGNISTEKQEMQIGNVNYEVDRKIYTETLTQAIEKAQEDSTIKLLNDYTDETIATFNKNIIFDIQEYTLTRDKTITINTGKTLEIIGTGKIATGETNVNTITNNGTLTIKDEVKIKNRSTNSSYAPIYTSNSNSITNINDNAIISGYYKGIYNNNGRVNVNGGYIEAINQTSSAYGIYNSSSSSKLYTNNGEIKGWNGIYNYNSSAIVEMTGGKVVGTGADGIYANGTTKIYGGRIEGKTYGIEGRATNKVTIGKQEEELSTTIPAIYGGNYGIYMYNTTYNFNFYNGVIIHNTQNTSYNGVANLRENHMTYTYLDYEIEQKYCTVLTPTVGNITMEATPPNAIYTNGDVKVKITYPQGEGIIREYSEDGTEWKQVEKYIENITVTENKTIYARRINQSGMIMEEKQLEVTNIDKELPVVTVTPTQTNYPVLKTTDTVNIQLTISATDTGVSGLDKMQYSWGEDGEVLNYIDFENNITIDKNNLKIGTYYLYLNVTDKAGNTAELTKLRYNVFFQEPVARIGDTVYATIQSAVEACSKEAGEEQTTITILKNTDEEFSTYEGQNIIIDLNGKTVGSSNQKTPICTNNGTLQIKDNSIEKTGKLESLNGTAIQNKGTITIGDNSNEIEFENPTIYGRKIGIENEGILNYYDGQIQGTVPIQGKVTATPEEYGPVSTGYENGITTVQLGIVNGYVARIEWVYYTDLQQAVDATKIYRNNNRDTVTILQNIQLHEILEISETKDIILDLNGYELTIISGKDRVINNNGNIEIIDSSDRKRGIINANTTSIYNNGTGKVTVSGGTVNSSNSNSSGIYNASTGSVEVNGGTVSSSGSSSSSYGINNASTGNIKVSGGIVKSGYYGIYNGSTGKVTVSGGTVSSDSYGINNARTGSVEVSGGTVISVSYGIYNGSTGKVTVSGGTISVSCFSSSRYTTSSGIYNGSTGKVIVSEGIVSSSGTTSYGINNASTGSVEVTGGTVSSSGGRSSSSLGSSCGINNERTGNVVVRGGIISSSGGTRFSYGINNVSTGIIIIGSKEDEIKSQNEPNIKAENEGKKACGIHNLLGNIEFYNGRIQGNTLALDGNITKIRKEYKIEENIIDNYDSIYLVKNNNTEYIAQIDETKYNTLNEAVESMKENEEKTIQILKDFELKEEKTVELNKNIILDLSGHTITNKYYRIENTNNLIITDTSKNRQGKIENLNTIIGIYSKDEGNIEISGGTVSSSGNSSSTSYGIYNASTGNIVVSGGTVSSSSSGNSNSASHGIYNASTGSVEVNGGTVSSSSSDNSSSTSHGIYNASTGSVEVNGGTVSSNSNNIGSYAHSYSYGIDNRSTGKVQVTGGTVSSSSYDYSYGINNASTGSIEVTGGTVSTSSLICYGIYNERTGKVTVSGGTVSSGNYGIYNMRTGSIEVSGGTVSGSSNGIYNSSTGKIIIGTKGDGIVSQEEPHIKGGYTGTSTSRNIYGIYNKYKEGLYFYDGIIEGTTKAVYDAITEREENTEFNYNQDQTVLKLTTTLTEVAQIVGGEKYKSLQEAINTVGEEKTTIEILRNVTYTQQDEKIAIPNNKNIKIDLKGYRIISTILETVIQNEGKLEIIDTSEEKTGTIISSTETTIKNNNGSELIISGGTIENRLQQVIYNEGKVTVSGGAVSSSNSGYNSGIYNNGTGNVTVSGGTVSSSSSGSGGYSYGINNASTGKVTVTGGTVSGKTISSGSTYSYGINNASTGNVIVSGGTVSSSCSYSSYSYGINNASTGKVTVTGGTVSSSSSSSSSGYSYGINNAGTGKVTVTGGTVSSSNSGYSHGIYNNGTGSITIGSKEDGVVSQESPKIISTTGNDNYQAYGIYNLKGILEFYDGAIQGKSKAINENITEIEEKAELLITTRASFDTVTLEQKDTNAVNVNGVEYDSISKAIKTCGETESTITLLRDVNPGATVIVEENQDITIDLNGHTINEYTDITNKGTLKIVDTLTEQTGRIVGRKDIKINNQGTMEISKCTISNFQYGINNTGTLSTNEATFTNNTYGIYSSSSNATTNITGGRISSNEYGTYTSTGTINITSQGVTNNKYGIYTAGGTTNIKNTSQIQSTTGIYNLGGTTNIEEGVTIQGTTGINCAGGTVNIGQIGTMNPETPIITGEQYGLKNQPGAIVYMYDGQIKGKTGATQGYITHTESGYAVANKTEGGYNIDYLVRAGTITTVAQANGIDYSSLQSALNSIIGEEVETVKLTNGIETDTELHIEEGQNIILDMNGKTITSSAGIAITNNGNLTIIDTSGNNVAKITNTVGIAIKNNGTLTLGENDGTVNQDLINVEGTTIGIENTGTLNFYDGTINGSSALTGTVTSRADGYLIKPTTVNGKERYYLSK